MRAFVMMRPSLVSVKQPMKVPAPVTTPIGAGVAVSPSEGAGVSTATVGAGVPSPGETKGAGVTDGRMLDEIS